MYCPGSIPTVAVEKYLTLAKISTLVYPVFRTLNIVLPFLKIAYLFDFPSYEDVLYMNVDQHDVNLLLVPFLP